MIYKNIEIHNIAELTEHEDGSVSWKRVPDEVCKTLEGRLADKVVRFATGVELRFVIRGENAVIRMSALGGDPKSFYTFHVFRGGIQGGVGALVQRDPSEGLPGGAVSLKVALRVERQGVRRRRRAERHLPTAGA